MPVFRYTLPDDDVREFEGVNENEAWLTRNSECWALDLSPSAFPITTNAGITNVQLEFIRTEIANGQTDPAVIATHINLPGLGTDQDFIDLVEEEVIAHGMST